LLYDLDDEPDGLRVRGGHQQRIIAVDYGTRNPGVFLDVYDDGRLFWVVREYCWDSAAQVRQKTDAEYADDLVTFIGPQDDAKVIIDPSAASFKAEMMKRRIWHVDADDEVNEGIRIVAMVLNQRMVGFCRQTVRKTIQEMQTYRMGLEGGTTGRRKTTKSPRSRAGCLPLLCKNRSAILAVSLEVNAERRTWKADSIPTGRSTTRGQPAPT
jgi:hypothetical protein